jgi:hypothetical protein
MYRLTALDSGSTGRASSQAIASWTGPKDKGGFCSLECYGKYYELDIRERAGRFVGSGGTGK